jgi:hypothetical protein
VSTATAVDYREEDFAKNVATYFVDIDASDLNAMQQDGATAIVDLAGEYESMGCSVNTALKAKVLGRLSDIQVRDFALGCHNDVTLPSYVTMWSDLLRWHLCVRPLVMKAEIKKVLRSTCAEPSQMMRGIHWPHCYNASLHQVGQLAPLPQCAQTFTPKSAL